MTLSTAQFVDGLKRECDLRCYDLGKGFKSKGILWRIRKMFLSLWSCIVILFWRRRGNECIYFACNSTAGLIYNILQSLVARIRGFRQVLHHHVYHYIENKDWRMSLLLKVTGQNCIHIMACKKMVDDFNQVYDRNINFRIAPPMAVESKQVEKSMDSGSFVLGHLSNLGPTKGINETIGTLRQLIQNGHDVKLRLAGPVGSVETQAIIDNASKEFSERIEYLGPVYDDAKVQFMKSINAFVFPTRIESWGIVLNEAMAAGTPVISVDRGCIRCQIGDGGVVVDHGCDFASGAAQVIAGWIKNQVDFENVCRCAIARAKTLEDEIGQAFASLYQTIIDPNNFTTTESK